jgi:hypothetical protein
LQDHLQFNGTWDVPWRLIAPQFPVLSHDELKKLSFEQLEKYNARRNAATTKGLYCPTGMPLDDHLLKSAEELDCRIGELTAEIWQDRLNAAKMVFGPPLGLFIFGYLIGWIIRGFAPRSGQKP